MSYVGTVELTADELTRALWGKGVASINKGVYEGTDIPWRKVPKDAVLTVEIRKGGATVRDHEGGWIAERFGPGLGHREGQRIAKHQGLVTVLLGENKSNEVKQRLQRALPKGRVLAALDPEALANRKTVDIQQEYDRWNRKLWDGQLPRISVKWSRSKTLGGRVVTRGVARDPSTWQVTLLEVSDFTESTYQEFLGILLHEMVHVYVMSRGLMDRGGQHGPYFNAERSRVQKLVPFEIPLREDITHKKVSEQVKAKPVGVALFTAQKAIQVYNDKAMPQVMQDIGELPQYWLERHPIEFYLVEDRELAKYPAKRKFNKRKVSYFPIDDEQVARVRRGRKLGSLPVAAAVGLTPRKNQDPRAQAFWRFVDRAAAQVDGWPEWMLHREPVAAEDAPAMPFKVGDPVLFGKYKNKRGRIVKFGRNPKGQVTVLIDPVPKGRKKTKELGLFKIWTTPDKVEAVAVDATLKGRWTKHDDGSFFHVDEQDDDTTYRLRKQSGQWHLYVNDVLASEFGPYRNVREAQRAAVNYSADRGLRNVRRLFEKFTKSSGATAAKIDKQVISLDHPDATKKQTAFFKQVAKILLSRLGNDDRLLQMHVAPWPLGRMALNVRVRVPWSSDVQEVIPLFKGNRFDGAVMTGVTKTLSKSAFLALLRRWPEDAMEHAGKKRDVEREKHQKLPDKIAEDVKKKSGVDLAEWLRLKRQIDEAKTPEEKLRLLEQMDKMTGANVQAVTAAFRQTVYHGTDAVFDKFDPKKQGSSTDEGLLGAGFYFSTDPAIARTHKYRLTVQVQLRNPLRVQASSWADAANKAKLVSEAVGLAQVKTGAVLTKAVRARGYDGVILDMSPVGYRHQEIVAYDAKAVKILSRETVACVTAAAVKPPLKELARSKKRFKGPNGNELAGYQWVSKIDDVYDKYEGGLVAKRVSDWDRAVPCASCRRNIVHIYWVVNHQTGKVEPYGGDHLHIALGYPRELGKSEVERMRKRVLDLAAEQKQESQKAEYYRKAYTKLINLRAVSLDSPKPLREANHKWLKTKLPEPSGQSYEHVWLVDRKQRLLMRADGNYTDLWDQYAPGKWERLSNDMIGKQVQELIGAAVTAATDELYHTTSLKGLAAILKGRTFKPAGLDGFVSFSERPLFGDISGNDAVLVLDRTKLRSRVMPVEYTEPWYERYPEHAAYVAGEGWREQYQEPEDCYDDEGWADEECVERAYRDAELDAFLDKRGEREWVGRAGGDLRLPADAFKRVVVVRAKLEVVEALLKKLGLRMPVKVLRGRAEAGFEHIGKDWNRRFYDRFVSLTADDPRAVGRATVGPRKVALRRLLGGKRLSLTVEWDQYNGELLGIVSFMLGGGRHERYHVDKLGRFRPLVDQPEKAAELLVRALEARTAHAAALPEDEADEATAIETPKKYRNRTNRCPPGHRSNEKETCIDMKERRKKRRWEQQQKARERRLAGR